MYVFTNDQIGPLGKITYWELNNVHLQIWANALVNTASIAEHVIWLILSLCSQLEKMASLLISPQIQLTSMWDSNSTSDQ